MIDRRAVVSGLLVSGVASAVSNAAASAVDGSTVSMWGKSWGVNAGRGTMALSSDIVRSTLRKGASACMIDSHRADHPERSFLTGKFLLPQRTSIHIRFRTMLTATPFAGPTDAWWTDLFQLMMMPDQDPVTKRFLEPFPTPQLALYVKTIKGIEHFNVMTRHDANKITTNPNPNETDRGSLRLTRGKWHAVAIDYLDSKGQDSGMLKVTIDGATLCNVTGPMGFNNDRGPYPSIGCYRSPNHAAVDVADVLHADLLISS